MFSTIPPSIKLCDQQSFRPSSIREKAEEMVAQMPRHHTFNGRVPKAAVGEGEVLGRRQVAAAVSC